MKHNTINAHPSALLPTFGRRAALPLAVLFLAMMSPLPGYAQEQRRVQSLEEIIVTATRRAQDAQSIPVSIAAVSGADLDSRGISSFTQLGQAVSGLSMVQPEGFVSASIYVRGVGTTGTNPADASVGVVVDGV